YRGSQPRVWARRLSAAAAPLGRDATQVVATDVSDGAATAGHELQDHHRERDEEQKVNEAGRHVKRNETHGPQHDQHDGDRPKHGNILFPRSALFEFWGALAR